MKRFYKDVAIRPVDAGWQVTLDGRAIRTAGGNPQIVPGRALAERLAQEWRDQGENIDTTGFPMRDMTDYAIDHAAPDRATVIDKVLAYGDTDTLCYRAESGSAFRTRQDEAWEPILAACEERLSVRFERIEGVLHRPHPADTAARLRADLETLSPFELTAVQNLATLAGSLVIAMEAMREGAEADALWAIANLEEDWQALQWGWDADALALRDTRLAGFSLAMEFARLLRD